MDIERRLFAVFDSIIFLIIIIFACIYSIPIIFIRRFHQHNHIFTLNVCVTTILCCFSWLPYMGAPMFDNPIDYIMNTGTFFNIVQTIFTIQVPFSFVVASIHRYCSVVYHTKIFFKRKQWIILCLGCQWMLGFILTIPNLIWINSTSQSSPWLNIYSFVSIVVLPSIICLVVNLLIYGHVRSSTRRVQVQGILNNKINHRDIYLIRHMIFMFCIFAGGWAPVYLIQIIGSYTSVNNTISSCFTIWCEIALLIDIIDLFLYNHEVRNYLKDFCRQYFIHE